MYVTSRQIFSDISRIIIIRFKCFRRRENKSECFEKRSNASEWVRRNIDGSKEIYYGQYISESLFR